MSGTRMTGGQVIADGLALAVGTVNTDEFEVEKSGWLQLRLRNPAGGLDGTVTLQTTLANGVHTFTALPWVTTGSLVTIPGLAAIDALTGDSTAVRLLDVHAIRLRLQVVVSAGTGLLDAVVREP